MESFIRDFLAYADGRADEFQARYHAEVPFRARALFEDVLAVLAAALDALRVVQESLGGADGFTPPPGHEEVIAILDTAGTILYESEAVRSELGYEPAALVGHALLEFVHPDDRQALGVIFEAGLQQGHEPVTTEFRFLHADGSWRVVRAHGRQMFHGTTAIGYVARYYALAEAA